MKRKIVLLILSALIAGCSLNIAMTGDSPASPTSNYRAQPAVLFTVEANRGWQNTDVAIHEGDRVTITYVGGQWTQFEGRTPLHDAADANGYRCGRSDCVEPYPDLPQGALIARVGTQIEPIGNAAIFKALMTRSLALRNNDGDAGLGDNAGAIQVSIVVETVAR